MIMMVVPNSRARKEEKKRKEEIEGTRRKGMLTTGEWCNPVSNMLHHV